jgi:hypothetical protein
MSALDFAYRMDGVSRALGHHKGCECGYCWGRGRYETEDGGERVCGVCRGAGFMDLCSVCGRERENGERFEERKDGALVCVACTEKEMERGN